MCDSPNILRIVPLWVVYVYTKINQWHDNIKITLVWAPTWAVLCIQVRSEPHEEFDVTLCMSLNLDSTTASLWPDITRRGTGEQGATGRERGK